MQSESAKGYGIQNDQHCQKTCAYHGQNNLPSFDLAPILFNFENTFLGIVIVSEASPQHRGEVPDETIPATEEELAASLGGTPGSKKSPPSSSPTSPGSSIPPSASQTGADDVPSQN